MIRPQICKVVVHFLTLVAIAAVVNAQSTERDNPTKLKSNEISGLIDSDSRGHFYYYSFMAGPGEVSITLTVEPGRPTTTTIALTSMGFNLYDRNAEELVGKSVSTTQSSGPGQAVARVEITRRQKVVLGISISDGALFKTVGGKYRLRINGPVDFNQASAEGSGGLTQADVDAAVASRTGACLPKQGTLIIKMKDGSKKLIDLSEAETITIVP
jgi:hypothetical protein